MTAAVQLGFDLESTERRCQYGVGGSGASCDLPATHAARNQAPGYECDCWGLAGPREKPGHTARLECCRRHADYYASAWAGPHLTFAQGCEHKRERTWVEVLEAVAA